MNTKALITAAIGLVLTFKAAPAFSQTVVYHTPFQLNGTPLEIDLNLQTSTEIRVYAQLRSTDTRAIVLALESSPGLKASMNVYAKSESKTRRKLQRRYNKSWPVSFISEGANPGATIRFSEGESPVKAALGFIQTDACNPRLSYILELVLDLREYKRSAVYQENFVRFGAVLSDVPDHQQTLFKYPSEKSTSLAVLLMKTATGGSRFVNAVDWSKGFPRMIKTFSVDQFFYSNQGIFTRTYIPASSLYGGAVTLEHIALGYSYGVCARYAKKRQQLEGYRR